MQASALIPILIVWIMLAVVVVIFAASRKPLLNEDKTSPDKYPQYFFMSLGMAFGIASGMLLGLAVGSISGGIAIGIGVGLIFGQSLEKRHKVNSHQLTEQEKRERLNRAGFGLVTIFILVLITLLTAVLQLLR